MKKSILIFLTAILFAATVCAADTKGGDPMKINIKINGKTELKATLSDNSSGHAFAELLEKGSVTVSMSDYGNFEKVGSLPKSLPRNDTQITTEPGDIILYQGNQITIYYDKNSWNFTRLGKIEGVTQAELKKILGTADVKAEFSLQNN